MSTQGFLLGVLCVLCGGVLFSADTNFRGRKAWTIENDKLRVTVLRGGGHIAELVLKNPPNGREVNPLWVPIWPSIEPSTYNKEKHGAIYGTDSEAPALAGLIGHNVAFDFWGGPSPTEFQAGMVFHGEISTTETKPVASTPNEFTYRADLTRTSLTRTLRFRPGQPILYFEETAENKTKYDLPFGWVQHVTFGPPFLDAKNSFFNASATRAEHRVGTAMKEFPWPVEGAQDFRRFSSAERSDDMAYSILDPKRDVAFVAALNTEYRQVVVYLFHRANFPWLNVWEQNRSRMTPPWKGETRTRGMEFGNARVGGTLKNYFRNPTQWDTPTFGWLDARQKITARFLALVVPTPAGFNEVRDVSISGSEILIAGPGSQTIKVPFDPALF